MTIILTVLHVIAAITLILTVLLQAGKGAGIGAAFGGSSETVFGAKGPTTFLSKLTAGVAITFMLTSLLLTYVSGLDTAGSIVPATPIQQQQGTAAPPPAPAEKK
jgi:preprotein translocase subunit SecG